MKLQEVEGDHKCNSYHC